MEIEKTNLPGPLLVKPRIFGDDRGFFYETWQQERYAEAGMPGPWVQDNLSFSRYGVLRGLHCQSPNQQGKLVSVLQGEVFDVVVDIRRGSPTFRRWIGVTLSAENKHQFWVPPGFAHGFCVVSEMALFCYKCTDFYNSEAEFTVQWNDPALGIEWPLRDPQLSPKDEKGPALKDIPVERLPVYQEQKA